MTVSDLLNQIKKLPISALDATVYIGTAKENYPYGLDYKTIYDTHSSTMLGDKFIIYSI